MVRPLLLSLLMQETCLCEPTQVRINMYAIVRDMDACVYIEDEGEGHRWFGCSVLRSIDVDSP